MGEEKPSDEAAECEKCCKGPLGGRERAAECQYAAKSLSVAWCACLESSNGSHAGNGLHERTNGVHASQRTLGGEDPLGGVYWEARGVCGVYYEDDLPVVPPMMAVVPVHYRQGRCILCGESLRCTCNALLQKEYLHGRSERRRGKKNGGKSRDHAGGSSARESHEHTHDDLPNLSVIRDPPLHQKSKGSMLASSKKDACFYSQGTVSSVQDAADAEGEGQGGGRSAGGRPRLQVKNSHKSGLTCCVLVM